MNCFDDVRQKLQLQESSDQANGSDWLYALLKVGSDLEAELIVAEVSRPAYSNPFVAVLSRLPEGFAKQRAAKFFGARLNG